MSEKERLSATVDAELLAVARAAVDAGRVESVSAWVNRALLREREHDERLKALEVLVADHESHHGAISDQEIRDARRRLSANTVAVRPTRVRRKPGAA